ncbi:MAG: glycosyltransferase family 2 protein [Candidatus Eisenbacteria bacterium]
MERPVQPRMEKSDGQAALDVLLPTCDRGESLTLALSGLAAQDIPRMRVVLADQSESPAADRSVIATLLRILEARGHAVEYHHRPKIWGIAEQRQFLLERARADAVLFLDDDVYLEPHVARRMLSVLRGERCGFVGAFPAGLSFACDRRPEQEKIEIWNGPIVPEAFRPGDSEWERWHLHRAANLHHVAQAFAPGEWRLYKVAWVASCVLYDREKLEAVGSFGFWSRLHRFHSGEEVLVQNLLLRNWGGCCIVPSGAYHTEVSSTVLNPAGSVDGHALELLDEMIERFGRVRAQAEVDRRSGGGAR